MDYANAVKKVRAEKPKDNFMILKFSDTNIVLPHKDAVALLATLGNAEMLDGWGSSRRLQPLEENKLESNPMSHQVYERHKIAALLNISYDSVLDAERTATQPPTP